MTKDDVIKFLKSNHPYLELYEVRDKHYPKNARMFLGYTGFKFKHNYLVGINFEEVAWSEGVILLDELRRAINIITPTMEKIDGTIKFHENANKSEFQSFQHANDGTEEKEMRERFYEEGKLIISQLNVVRSLLTS
tara:strand:+ start:3853 stop:4260 length:408 start_codon:yes stop_codon:yes gene_type:complete